MSKVKLDKILNKFEETHGDTYDYSKVEYTGSHSQVTIICKTHGEFTQRVYDHIYGAGCPTCASEAKSLKTRTQWEDLLNEFNKVWSGRYTYHYDTYTNSRTKMKITCPDHGHFYQAPSQHLKGRNGCRECAEWLTQDSLLARVPNNPDYDYSKVNYINTRTKVTVVCKYHGEFEILPHNLLKGAGCRQCGIESAREKRKKGPTFYLPKFKEEHGDIYEYPEHFTGSDKINIVCNTHGEFTQSVQDHRDGHGCPQCFYDNPGTALDWGKFEDKHGNPVHELLFYSGYYEPTTVVCKESGTVYGTTPHKYSVSPSNKCPSCSKVSTPHRTLLNEIDKLNIKYEINTRQIIPPLELDIYIPQHNFAIEVCGLYYHSHPIVRDKHYHQNKFLRCEALGIKLIQVWESEIKEKLPLVVSMIKSNLGLLDKRIYARNCEIINLSLKDYQEFLTSNHLESSNVVSTERKGLVHDGELVSVAGFKGSVMQRFASLSGVSVVGGFSKLLNAFNKEHVVTYSDNRYSNGNLYKANGFQMTKENKYRMSVTDTHSVFNREKFSKKYLKDYPGYSDDLTAEEILGNNGLYYLYGPGTRKWELKR